MSAAVATRPAKKAAAPKPLTMAQKKAAALDMLLTGPMRPEKGDPLRDALYQLWAIDYLPIVMRDVGTWREPQLEYEMVHTLLSRDEIKEQRTRGLELALNWQRREEPARWPALIQSIENVFARDSAAAYLRVMVQRARVIASFGGKA